MTVKIEVPAETDEAEAFERDRSGARWIEDAPAFTSSMNPVVMDSTEPRGPRGGSGGDDDDPSSSKDDDFYAQSGEAIRVLREDYPSLLTKEPRWSIYREDIGLYDETMTFAGPGRDGRTEIMAKHWRIQARLQNRSNHSSRALLPEHDGGFENLVTVRNVGSENDSRAMERSRKGSTRRIHRTDEAFDGISSTS